MRPISNAMLGAGLLLLAACGENPAEPEAMANGVETETLNPEEGVLQPTNGADAADVSATEANAMDSAIESALNDSAEANGQ